MEVASISIGTLEPGSITNLLDAIDARDKAAVPATQQRSVKFFTASNVDNNCYSPNLLILRNRTALARIMLNLEGGAHGESAARFILASPMAAHRFLDDPADGGFAMFCNLVHLKSSKSKLSRSVRRALAIAGGLMLALCVQAHASVVPGDQFDFNWTETSGANPGLTGTGILTVGVPLAAPDFSISSFSVTQNGGFCGVCSSVTTDFSGAEFDSSTMGLLGDITGSYTGSGGGTHTFVLSFTDIVSLSGGWTFDDTSATGALAETVGTYTPLVPAVPEPLTLSLFGAGLAGAVAMRRRKKRVV